MLSRNAGILNLQQHIESLSDHELAEQVSLLIEVPTALYPYIWPRLRLATWELRRRLQDRSVA